ncbi:MAG: 50S ribosomal protein L32 [Verrucomicrobiota bacterium]
MAVPKSRTSKSKIRKRVASHRKDPIQLRTDTKTKSKHLSHRVDPATGMYRGRQVISVTAEG